MRGAVRGLLTERIRAGALRTQGAAREPGDLVLVACSGGADSLALAAATAFVAPRLGLRAGAVSVDHGMQPGSAQISRRAIDQCADLGLDPALVRPAGAAPTGQGPEAAARAVRYRALEEAAVQTGAAAILLGHTMDDQAETVLLALARGSGTRAVAGMAPARGRYLRPLLGVRRARTEAACAEAGLEPWEDPANVADGPWRSATGAALPRAALREQVLPVLTQVLGPEVTAALSRTADLARADADLLDDLAAQAYQEASQRAEQPASPDTGQRAGRQASRGPQTPDPQTPGPERPGPQKPVPEEQASQEAGQHHRPAAGRSGPPQESADRADDDGTDPGAVVLLSVQVLQQQPAALLTRMVHTAAVSAGVPPGALGSVHVLAVAGLITAWHGQGPIHLPGGIRAVRRYGNLVLAPEPVTAPLPPTQRSGDSRGRQHDG